MLKKTHLVTAASAFLILGSIPWIVAESAGTTKTDTANTSKKNRLTALNDTETSKDVPVSKDSEAKKPLDQKKADPAHKETPKTSDPAKVDEKDQVEILKLSEAFGHFIGRNLKNPGAVFDLESIIKGMREGASGKPAPMSEQEYEDLMTKVQQRSFQEMAKSNLNSAETFLQDNEKKLGVVSLVPGKLQYEVVKEGTGEASVKEHGTPEIHYTGKYIDGTVFGSSQDTGYPITIPLDQTVPGFSKGIIGMKEGEKRRLYIHPELGYGTSGHLAPNALLIFDIEIVKPEAPKKDLSMSDEGQDDDLLLDSDEDSENMDADSMSDIDRDNSMSEKKMDAEKKASTPKTSQTPAKDPDLSRITAADKPSEKPLKSSSSKTTDKSSDKSSKTTTEDDNEDEDEDYDDEDSDEDDEDEDSDEDDEDEDLDDNEDEEVLIEEDEYEQSPKNSSDQNVKKREKMQEKTAPSQNMKPAAAPKSPSTSSESLPIQMPQ